MINDDIKVSIVCNTYNQEKFIEDAINGFLEQKTNFKFEIVIHDDASDDCTADIINRYQSLYPEVVKPIYEKENQYSQKKDFFSKTILPRLNGEYVAWCEGDDYWIDPFKLQRQIDFLESNNDYVACAHNSMKIDGKTGAELGKLYNITEDKDMTMRDAISNTGILYQTASLVYRKKIIYDFINNKMKKEAQKIGVGDHPLRIYLLTKGKVRILREIMSVYRCNSVGSWSENDLYNKKINPINYWKACRYYRSVNIYTRGEYEDICKGIICDNLLGYFRCTKRYYFYKRILFIRCKYPFEHKKNKIKYFFEVLLAIVK